MSVGKRPDQRLLEGADQRGRDHGCVERLDLARGDSLLEKPREDVAVSPLAFEPGRLDCRIDWLGHQRIRELGRGEGTSHKDLDRFGEPFACGQIMVLDDPGDQGLLAAGCLPEDLCEEIGLRAEVAIDGPGGDAGAPRDELHLGSGVAIRGDDLVCRGEDPVPGLDPALRGEVSWMPAHRDESES